MDSFREAAIAAIKAAFKELKAGCDHDDCVQKTFSKLREAGYEVEKEKELLLQDGNYGKPDLTIVGQSKNKLTIIASIDGGSGNSAGPGSGTGTLMGLESRNLCFIEIKCKNHFDQEDIKQAEKFRDAENGRVPVVLANMQPGKPEPNIRVF